jgi:hypothetical protein
VFRNESTAINANPRTESRSAATRRFPVAIPLAAAGGVFAVVQLVILGHWVFSEQFTSTPTGADTVAGWDLFWTRAWEVLSVVGSVGFVIWMARHFKTNPTVRTITIVVGAWMLTAWQDPGVNFARPAFSYSSAFFNLGTWDQQVPFWPIRAGGNPQPVLFWIATYLLFVPLVMINTQAIMTWVRNRLPGWGIARLAVVLFFVMAIQDVLIEELWIWQGLYRYVRVPEHFAILPGTFMQMPLYEVIFWGGGMTALVGIMFVFRHDDGTMATDGGIERVPSRYRTAVRVLALGGVLNIAFLLFNFGFNVNNHFADVNLTPQQAPSYMTNDMCGLAANAPCHN